MSRFTWYETIWNGLTTPEVAMRSIVLDPNMCPRPPIWVNYGPTVKDRQSHQQAVRGDFIVTTNTLRRGTEILHDTVYFMVVGGKPLHKVVIVDDILISRIDESINSYPQFVDFLLAKDWQPGKDGESIVPAFGRYDGEVGLLSQRNSSIVRSHLAALPEEFVEYYERLALKSMRHHVDPKAYQSMPRKMTGGLVNPESRDRPNPDCQPVWVLYRLDGSSTIHYPLEVAVDSTIPEDVTYAVRLWPESFLDAYDKPYGMKLEVFHDDTTGR